MTLNESHVEEAALEWFPVRQSYGGQIGELCCAVGYEPDFARSETAAEREQVCKVEHRTFNIQRRRDEVRTR